MKDLFSPSVDPTKLKVLVCGGRDYPHRDRVFRELDLLCGEVTEEHRLGTVALTIIQGECPTGADAWAVEWAMVNWAQLKCFAAEWGKYSRAAGPLRNTRMLAEGAPDIVLAFKGGRGTVDMVRKARAACVEVREFE